MSPSGRFLSLQRHCLKLRSKADVNYAQQKGLTAPSHNTVPEP